MLRNVSILIIGLMLSLFILSCEKEDNGYDIPATYDFENVSYSGQLERLGMLMEMEEYMGTTSEGNAVDEDRLLAMYANEQGAQFEGDYEKNLRSKTFPSAVSVIEGWIEDLATASQSNMPGSEGQAGVVTGNNGEKSYLLSSNGLDIPQLIEKGLMGSCFMHQALQVYLGEDRMNVDNEEVEEGVGTAMQHHWDEAFGYLGVPRDFPSNTNSVFYWGDYTVSADAHFDCAQPLMDAFIKGRAAINHKDYETRDEQIRIIRETWEQICASQAIHYLNSAAENIDDDAIRSHGLSEGLAFVFSLRFNTLNTVSNDQIDDWLAQMGGTGSENFQEMNLYDVEVADLMQVRDEIAEAYELVDVKEEL